MFSHPFKSALGRRVVISAAGDTWRGVLDSYRDEWLTLTHAEYVHNQGSIPADGNIMIPESIIDYMQVTTGTDEGGGV